MIAVTLSPGPLRDGFVRAARPDEDVICGKDGALEALERGFPRLVVTTAAELSFLKRVAARGPGGVSLLAFVDSRAAQYLGASEGEVRVTAAIVGVDDHPARIAALVRNAAATSYADRVLDFLSESANFPLPSAFSGFARRVLEYPALYSDLHGIARLTGLSQGALKARFRRRDLPSPFLYLRWLRILAAAHLLSSRPEVSIGQSALRLGFSSGPNLARAVCGLTGLIPSELRQTAALFRLVNRFARGNLARYQLAVWEDFRPLFIRSAA